MSLAFIFAVICGVFVAVVFGLVVLTIVFGLKEEMRFTKLGAKKQKLPEPEDTPVTEPGGPATPGA